MTRLLLFTAVAALALSQKTPKTVREKFPRTFESGVSVKEGDFTVVPYSHTDSRVTDFGITCTRRGVDHVIVRVFYFRSVKGMGDLLLSKEVETSTYQDLPTLTNPIEINVANIRMIRLIGLHEEATADIR